MLKPDEPASDADLAMAEQAASARERVEALRAEAEEDAAQLTGRIADITAARAGDNSDDEHDPEGATLAFERSQADALRASALARLAAADAVLARIAAGAYGRCAVCGEAIAPARLAARPLTDRCIRHA